MARYRIGLIVCIATMSACAWALPAGARQSAPSATRVTNVTVTAGKPSEFRFALSKKSVPVGTVVFTVKNAGALSHDFKIAGKTSKQLAKGASTKLTVVFKKAGSFKYLCTESGHAAAGMVGTLKVVK